ncbi:hypothetical protein, partial [Gluconacetobacter entanii]|uniref:hypothetical protein n=1 Tax=Gluconacetobacter entanii TaxID=108528 RepID=UPI001C1313DF
SRHEVLQKTLLDADRQPAATTYFHTTYQAFIGLPMPALFQKASKDVAFLKKGNTQKLLLL